MRTLLFGVLAAAAASFQVPGPAGQVQRDRVPSLPSSGALTISGHVVTGDGPDARPVRRALVRLQRESDRAERVVNADASGGYRVDKLPPGMYRLVGAKAGFVTGGYGTGEQHPPIDLKASAQMDIGLTRGAAIEGVITTPSGEPLANITVGVDILQPDGGWRMDVRARTYTDDLGRYRLHSLKGGEYRVAATTDPAYVNSLAILPGERRPSGTIVYYPGVQKPEDAKAVHVSESSEIEGIDLTFSPPSPTRIPDAPKPVYAGPTGTGTISGRVVSEPGPPISGVAVTLIPASAGAAKRLARTNAQGRFEFSELPQGRFSISATAPGYVEWEFGQRRPSEPGTVVELSDGGSFNKADIRLPRQLAIEGTILDEFGDPAPGVTLQPARWQFIAARKRLFPIEGRGMRQTTDDKGHYRLPALPPGEYFLAAQTGVFSDDPDMGGFAPTYFPGTVDVSAAASLQLTVGSDNLTANFSLVPATTVTVSGVAVDHDGAAVSNAAILLTTRDALKKPEARITRASAGSDGRFTLRNVPQGAYTLQGFGHPPAGGPGNLNAGPFGWSPVMVGDSDVDGVILTIVPGRTLRGRVSREDPDGPALATAGVRVMPIPVDFDSAPVAGGPLPSVTHEDGTFEVTNVNGIVRLFVNSGSPSWVVKRISVDGRDVTDAPLDLREHDVSGIDVVMTSRITHVSGGVTNEKNESLSDYAVVVFSVDPGKWGDRSRFIRLVRPADNGRFSVNGLPAEDYLAIALPNVNAIEYFDPDFLQALRPLATSFTLQEGGSQTLELKLTRRPIT